jgi:co-chaperonin GroES (HSP10)
MIRPIEPDRSHGGIIIPDPQKRTNANTLGRGIVLAMGPPALSKKGVEVPPNFKVGDEVLHIGQHVSRDSWNNGERVRYCAQEEVQCVIEP